MEALARKPSRLRSTWFDSNRLQMQALICLAFSSHNITIIRSLWGMVRAMTTPFYTTNEPRWTWTPRRNLFDPPKVYNAHARNLVLTTKSTTPTHWLLRINFCFTFDNIVKGCIKVLIISTLIQTKLEKSQSETRDWKRRPTKGTVTSRVWSFRLIKRYAQSLYSPKKTMASICTRKSTAHYAQGFHLLFKDTTADKPS